MFFQGLSKLATILPTFSFNLIVLYFFEHPVTPLSVFFPGKVDFLKFPCSTDWIPWSRLHEHPASLAVWPNNSTWNRIFRRPAWIQAGQRTAPRVLAVDSPPDISRILLLFRVDNFKFIKVVGKQIYFYNALNSASQGEQVIFQAASVTD